MNSTPWDLTIKLLPYFSFDLFIQQFGEEFYNAAAKQTELQGAMEIGLLRETVTQLKDISTIHRADSHRC